MLQKCRIDSPVAPKRQSVNTERGTKDLHAVAWKLRRTDVKFASTNVSSYRDARRDTTPATTTFPLLPAAVNSGDDRLSLHEFLEIYVTMNATSRRNPIRKHSGPHRLATNAQFIYICTCVCLQCINALEIWMFVRDEIWCKHCIGEELRCTVCSDVLCALSNCRVRGRDRSEYILFLACHWIPVYMRGMPMMHEWYDNGE